MTALKSAHERSTFHPDINPRVRAVAAVLWHQKSAEKNKEEKDD